MPVRLVNARGEEIVVENVSRHRDWFHGTVQRMACRGDTLRLFYEWEHFMLDQVVHEADRISLLIDQLGFRVGSSVDDVPAGECAQLRVVNGDAVAFKIVSGERSDLEGGTPE